jgi:uncharacterized protein (DUF58 family)
VKRRATRRLLLGLLLGVPLLALAPVFPGVVVLVLALDAVLIAAALGEARRLRLRGRLRVARTLPARLSVGAWNEVTLEVENLSPLPLRVRVEDEPPFELDCRPGPDEARLPPYGRARLGYELRPRRRGRYRFGGGRALVEGALGLAAVEQPLGLAAEATVYPDVSSLRRLVLGSRFKDLSTFGFRTLRREGQGDEFDKLRDYLPDDDYRDISWKATAKRSRPITQVYETERAQRVLIGIDCGRSMAAQAGELSKLDLAVNAALVLAYVALRAGDLVGLLLFAGEIQALLPPGKGPRQLARLVEVAARASAELTFVDYRALNLELSRRRMRRSLVVIFTDLLDEQASAPLVEASRLLRRKHAVLIVAPSDAAVMAAAAAPAEDALGVYRGLAAREALAERRATLERARRLGVELVDARASELAVAGVNRYLAMKARRAI